MMQLEMIFLQVKLRNKIMVITKIDDGHRYKDVCIVTPIAYFLLHWFKCQP